MTASPHGPDCWQKAEHHGCAVAKITLLRQALAAADDLLEGELGVRWDLPLQGYVYRAKTLMRRAR